MTDVLMMTVRVATALSVLCFLVLTGWSFVTGQHALLTVVSAMLTAGFGYFTYRDIKKVFFGK